MSKPSSVVIRPGTPADLSEVQRLNQALFAYEKDQVLHGEAVYNQNWPYEPAGVAYFTDCLSNSPGTVIFMAEHSGKPVGYLAASCGSFAYLSQNPIAEIENMFVEPSFRRQSVGSQLIAAFKDWAQTKDARRLKVGALVQNHPAVAFYRRNGFEDFITYLETSLDPLRR